MAYNAVITDCLYTYVYSGPSEKSPFLCKLEGLDEIKVLSKENDDWLLVHVEQNFSGYTGYCQSKYVTMQEDGT